MALPLRMGAAIGVAVALSGCQTSTTYVPIVPNPVQIDMAKARCDMMAPGVQQGMYAWGSPSYVAGAQIGNAIGNAIRMDQFVQQCMTLQGWKRVVVPEGGTAPSSAPRQSAAVPDIAPVVRKNTFDMFAAGYAADRCKIAILPQKRILLNDIAKSDPALASAARTHGAKVFNDGVQKAGKPAACAAARGALKDLNWLH